MLFKNKTITVALASTALLLTACNKKPDVYIKNFDGGDTVKYCLKETEKTESCYVIYIRFDANGKKRTVSSNQFTAKNNGQLVDTASYFVTGLKEGGTYTYENTSTDPLTYDSGGGGSFYVGFKKNVTDCKFYYDNVVIAADDI